MPMAHNVRPTTAQETDTPGEYEAQIELEIQNEKVAHEEVVRRKQVEADVANEELTKLEAWRR